MTIPHDKLKQHLDHIRNELLENARKHLEFQRAEEERKEKRRKLEERKLAKSLEKERREEQRKEREELMKKQEAKRKALQAKAKGAQITFVEPVDMGAQRGNSRKRKRETNQYEDQREAEPKRIRREQPQFSHMDQFDKAGGGGDGEDKEYGGRFEEDEEVDLLADEESGKKKLKRKKKKKKGKDKKKKKKGEMDEEEWSRLEIKIEEIVRSANLNELTNRQVKKQLAECFPDVNIKSYKQRIKEKINAVAAELAQAD